MGDVHLLSSVAELWADVISLRTSESKTPVDVSASLWTRLLRKVGGRQAE